ncbi:MAG: EamA family transporter [bacterium]|nr:EamA family transporter [bacterium]MBK8130847.1 EamA family transporter [bacterium]
MVILAYVALCLIWGTTYLVIKVALEGFPPFVLGAVRFALAGIIFLPYMLRDRKRLPQTRAQWGWIALTGTMMLAGGNGLVNFAEQYIDSGLTALTVATSPAWSAVFSWMIIGESEKLDRMSLVGIALAMTGIYVLHHDHISLSADEWPGFVALILCPPLWTLASVLSRKYLRELDAFTVSATQMFSGAVAFGIISLIIGESWALAPSAKAIGALLYLTVLGSVVAFTAYAYLLKRVPAARVNTYTFINPVIALVAGAVILSEPITPEVYPATALILAGMGILYAMRNRRAGQTK